MKLFGTMQSQQNMLTIGGLSVKDLVATYQTPLIVYDETLLRSQCQTMRTSFIHPNVQTRILYASKAFTCKAMLRLVKEEGLALDVVSSGELETAVAVDFPMIDVVFHGNNKSDEELRRALSLGVGTIVIDGPCEAQRLIDLTNHTQSSCDVLVRVNPGIDAHTHEYIQTATSDAKFGVAIDHPSTLELLRHLASAPYIQLRGIHCHIGSQIFASDSFEKAARTMLDYVAKLKNEGLLLDTLDLGGGFGVYYTQGDSPFSMTKFLETLAQTVSTFAKERGVSLSRLWLEPGRYLVCNAGTTLYTIGDIKHLKTANVHYAFIDGGMADNPRPALYQAEYEATIANRMDEVPTKHWRIGGKCCESGDILIRDALLPDVHTGDILAVGSTGAYTYSMSGNYNRLAKPAVVFVNPKDGARLVLRRQEISDLLSLDVDETPNEA